MTQQAIGGALVSEVRRCSCGREYQMPHSNIAQLFADTISKEVRQWEPANPSDIYGRHRTVYLYHSTCEACPICFQSSIVWADLSSLELHQERPYITRGDAGAGVSLSEAKSERDRLAADMLRQQEAMNAAIDSFNHAKIAWKIAKARVHSFNEVVVGPPRPSTRVIEKPARERTPTVALTNDDL